MKVVYARAQDLVATGPQGEWRAEAILREAAGELDDPFAGPLNDEGAE